MIQVLQVKSLIYRCGCRVRGPLLFTYICDQDEYTEATVKNYTRQLMSALAWLHQKDISHLDVKVYIFQNRQNNTIIIPCNNYTSA